MTSVARPVTTLKALHNVRDLLSRSDIRITGANTLWLASEKAVRMLMGLVVGLWVARYLGPESYGQLQYAIAWISLFGAIAWFGVGDALVRDLVRDGAREGDLLGAAFAIRFAGSVLAMVLAASVCTLLFPQDRQVTKLVWIICLATPFAEMPGGIRIWFQSRLQVRLPILMLNISLLLGGALQVSLILIHAPLTAFAWVLVAEAVFMCAAIFAVYKWRGGRISSWRIRAPTIKHMLISGTPIILASLVASLNARLDELMLAWLSGFHDVGIYHAVTRFSTIWWAIPLVLMTALAPKYIYPENLGGRLQRNVACISAALLAFAIVPCIVLPLVGGHVIGVVLSREYIDGAPVLMIHIWIAIFVFLDAPATQYLLATNRQAILIWKSISALIVNVALNVLLVPRMGAVGAAIATLAAQAWVGCVFYMVHPKVRDVHAIQRAALRQLLWDWWHPKMAVS